MSETNPQANNAFSVLQITPTIYLQFTLLMQRCQPKKIEIRETANFTSRYLFTVLKMDLK